MIKQRFSEVSFVDLPPMRVACFRAVSRTPEDDAMKVLTQWAAGAGLREPYRAFGFDVQVSTEQAQSGLRGYELWFVISDGVLASGPVEIREFPGGRFAAMTLYEPFVDPFERIPTGWDALHEWVITHGYEDPESMLCLEEVIDHDGERDMVIYHPVKFG